jgi:hypothetical protein
MLEEMRSRPEEWRLFPELTGRPASLLRRIRRRRVRALRDPAGVVQVRPGWVGTTVEGKNIADIYLRYVPHKEHE